MDLVDQIILSAETALGGVGLHPAGRYCEPESVIRIFVGREHTCVTALTALVDSGVPPEIAMNIAGGHTGLVDLRLFVGLTVEPRWVLRRWTPAGLSPSGWLPAGPDFDNPQQLARLAASAKVAFP